MQRRRRLSFEDMLLVGGFLAVLAGLLAAGCYEAYKIVAVIPSAFEVSPDVLRNPMRASEDDSQPNQPGAPRMTAQQRAQNLRAAQQGR
jgi:hypothetical protein